MDFILLFTADLYVTHFVDGQITGSYWATLTHQMYFETMDVCESYRQAHAEEIIENLEGPYRAFWQREFDIPERFLFIDSTSECFQESL